MFNMGRMVAPMLRRPQMAQSMPFMGNNVPRPQMLGAQQPDIDAYTRQKMQAAQGAAGGAPALGPGMQIPPSSAMGPAQGMGGMTDMRARLMPASGGPMPAQGFGGFASQPGYTGQPAGGAKSRPQPGSKSQKQPTMGISPSPAGNGQVAW
jgi:hypothetical protein